MSDRASTENCVTAEICLLSQGAALPTCAYSGDAGLDLRSIQALTLQPFERAPVPCGIALALPEGHAGLIVPRSGLAVNHGVSVLNGPGLIDSGYRGEIKVVLINLDPHEPFLINVGDRIAQLVIIRTPEVTLQVTESLSRSFRNMGGFGSSGR